MCQATPWSYLAPPTDPMPTWALPIQQKHWPNNSFGLLGPSHSPPASKCSDNTNKHMCQAIPWNWPGQTCHWVMKTQRHLPSNSWGLLGPSHWPHANLWWCSNPFPNRFSCHRHGNQQPKASNSNCPLALAPSLPSTSPEPPIDLMHKCHWVMKSHKVPNNPYRLLGPSLWSHLIWVHLNSGVWKQGAWKNITMKCVKNFRGNDCTCQLLVLGNMACKLSAPGLSDLQSSIRWNCKQIWSVLLLGC